MFAASAFFPLLLCFHMPCQVSATSAGVTHQPCGTCLDASCFILVGKARLTRGIHRNVAALVHPTMTRNNHKKISYKVEYFKNSLNTDSGFYAKWCEHTQVRGVRSTSSSSQLTRATDGKPAGSPARVIHTQTHTPHTNTGSRLMCCAGSQVWKLRWKREKVKGWRDSDMVRERLRENAEGESWIEDEGSLERFTGTLRDSERTQEGKKKMTRGLSSG